MIYPKQLKDLECTEAVIRIKLVREVFKENSQSTSYKDKLRCIEIKKPTVITSTCFPITKKGNKELIKFIKQGLYLR